MTNKRKRATVAAPTNPLPTNEFGEIILEDNNIELSKVPTTEVDVAELKDATEDASSDTPETSVEETSEELTGDASETNEEDEPKLPGDSEETPSSNDALDLSGDAPLNLTPTSVTPDEPAGVIKMAIFDGQVTALKVTSDEDKIIERLKGKAVTIANYEDDEGAVNPIVEVITGRIQKHFGFILGTASFRDEKHKLEQVVSFGQQMIRLTQLEENCFFKVMDYIMTEMRNRGEKLSPTQMFRFNLVAAKDFSTDMNRYNDFMNVCYKFARNYADRSKLISQIDFNKVCAGRTVKEAELLKTYFRKLANS
ncbi:hypothetical protein [Shewanella phage FishSpeaker]|nr:hypothetical protein [Shewanella phage FishSpeaker]